MTAKAPDTKAAIHEGVPNSSSTVAVVPSVVNALANRVPRTSTKFKPHPPERAGSTPVACPPPRAASWPNHVQQANVPRTGRFVPATPIQPGVIAACGLHSGVSQHTQDGHWAVPPTRVAGRRPANPTGPQQKRRLSATFGKAAARWWGIRVSGVSAIVVARSIGDQVRNKSTPLINITSPAIFAVKDDYSRESSPWCDVKSMLSPAKADGHLDPGSNVRPLRLATPVRRHLARIATDSQPLESCALLAGNGDQVMAIHALRNIHPESRTRYAVEPEEYLQAESRVEAQGQHVIGIFHSHPHSEAAPSITDHAHALPETWYLIHGFPPGGANGGELRAWRLGNDGQFMEHPIIHPEAQP